MQKCYRLGRALIAGKDLVNDIIKRPDFPNHFRNLYPAHMRHNFPAGFFLSFPQTRLEESADTAAFPCSIPHSLRPCTACSGRPEPLDASPAEYKSKVIAYGHVGPWVLQDYSRNACRNSNLHSCVGSSCTEAITNKPCYVWVREVVPKCTRIWILLTGNVIRLYGCKNIILWMHLEFLPGGWHPTIQIFCFRRMVYDGSWFCD